MRIRILPLLGLTWFFLCPAQAQDPCGTVKARALALSGGGPKGAFETGAVYHLVAHRDCDFDEFAGVSVGALNAAFLAQAAKSSNPEESHANLVGQSEGLVSLWESIKSANDVAKGRPLAMLRFGLFGLENLKDFRPFRRLLEANISPEKLAKGRSVRVGVVSFWDGGYREILAKDGRSGGATATFLDYLYASAVPPVYGKLPRIADGTQPQDPAQWPQFADAGMRHDTPVVSYFRTCRTAAPAEGRSPSPRSESEEACKPVDASSTPAHGPLQQLFVIVTNPYSRDSDQLLVNDPKCCRPGSRQITNGRKILGRTLELMGEATYRWDLDYLLFANGILRRRAEAYRDLTANTPAEQLPEAKRQFKRFTSLPFESYNRDPQDADGPSLPYDLGLVAPEKQYTQVTNLLVFTRSGTREQLYCGCVAADKMMQNDFGQPSLAAKCAERFPPLQDAAKGSASVAAKQWDARVCQPVTAANK